MVARRIFLLLLVGSLAACGQSGFSDLDAYMAEMNARPVGQIEPIPLFPPYKAFTYESQTKRPPFERPTPIIVDTNPDENVEPIPHNPQFLEGFPIESLAMVGTLEQKGQLWALVMDGSGGIHRVSIGDYLGEDNGRIEQISQTDIRVMEVTPTGTGAWAKRPRQLQLRVPN